MSSWSDIDEQAVLALNALNEVETSFLDGAALDIFIREAFHIGLRARGRDAFLIALDQTIAYASPNFQWFKNRYARFIYVDRVVVAASARGRGLARSLYEELFVLAAEAGHALIACEVNVQPPNPASHAFHASLAFAEVGRGGRPDGVKVVSYLIRALNGEKQR